MLKIIEKTKVWFSISLIIILIGMFALVKNGLNYGIDFKGGTIIEIQIGKDFNKADIDSIVKKYTKEFKTNKANKTQIEIKSNSLTVKDASSLFKDIKQKYNLKDKSLIDQSKIGPSIGKELKKKAVLSLIVATLAMLIYVAIRFEFKFGLAAVLALVHDVLITLSIYAIFRIPVNSAFIAAILTILGYSINDTIVIFDRIRENKKLQKKIGVAELVNSSITQTMSRSINTVLTTLFTIVSVYIFVPSVREYSFPITIGIISGAYSSIFIASPLWVIFNKFSKSKTVKN